MTAAFERFTDSQPILKMLDILSNTGRGNFHKDGAWEVCLCALILRLEPQCKVTRVLESLPYDNHHMDEIDFLNSLAHLGYFCRKAESDLHDIDDRLLPAVFIPTNGKPTIIWGRNDEGHFYFLTLHHNWSVLSHRLLIKKGQYGFFKIMTRRAPEFQNLCVAEADIVGFGHC